MSARLSKSRQEPLGPDETFSALVTRLIITNRAERAKRERTRPTIVSDVPESGTDRRREPRSGSGAES
jgi:hypothetical protein